MDRPGASHQPRRCRGNGWPVGGGWVDSYYRKKMPRHEVLYKWSQRVVKTFLISIKFQMGRLGANFFWNTCLLRFNFRWLGPNISNIFNIFTLCRWCWMSTVAKNRKQNQQVSTSQLWGFQLGSAQPIYYYVVSSNRKQWRSIDKSITINQYWYV